MKGDVVVHVMEPATLAHAPAVLPAPVLAGADLMAAATVTGAWLARLRPGHREIWFAAAAGALLIIAGLHLLPDAWAGTPLGDRCRSYRRGRNAPSSAFIRWPACGRGTARFHGHVTEARWRSAGQ